MGSSQLRVTSASDSESEPERRLALLGLARTAHWGQQRRASAMAARRAGDHHVVPGSPGEARCRWHGARPGASYLTAAIMLEATIADPEAAGAQ